MIRADRANIEGAVRDRIFEQNAEVVKARNSGLAAEVIEAAIDEALSMTRRGNAARPDGN
jgi:hypothetical protein